MRVLEMLKLQIMKVWQERHCCKEIHGVFVSEQLPESGLMNFKGILLLD